MALFGLEVGRLELRAANSSCCWCGVRIRFSRGLCVDVMLGKCLMDDVGDKTGPLAVNNEEGRMITDDDRLSKRLWSWWTRSASCLSESKGQEDSGA